MGGGVLAMAAYPLVERLADEHAADFRFRRFLVRPMMPIRHGKFGVGLMCPHRRGVLAG
jgi:hypothetical protein